MYKKIICLVLVSFIFVGAANAASLPLAKRFSGRFLLQTELYGRIWYVNPNDSQRYYINKGAEGYRTLLDLSLNISEKDLSKIPENKNQRGDTKLVSRLSGMLLYLESKNELWYLSPVTKLKYLINQDDPTTSLRTLVCGINNKNLGQIPMNSTQIAFDGTFTGVAHVKFDGEKFSNEYYADKILPPASMTKLMTALILTDLKFDFNQLIQITQEEIEYPIYYAGDDKTSEIDLAAGDWVSGKDLFVALLVASSNQSAAILADATGLSREEFVGLMNKKAQELGLKKTIFHDVSGLDSHNLTTPKEMALIAQAAFSKPEIANTSIIRQYTISAQDKDLRLKNIDVANRNYSLLDFNPDGVKTGFLVEAQRTAVIKKGDDILVVMHANSMNERNKIFNNLLKN